ncbi:hypothetical protein [Hymenobacter crusticola]|uniref:Magnesium citrate secondary transporter n=1 Tax=Hymenobacter crusticola TaxID=1770526 RepID=A0A243WCE8_9BACT|nr:hypothetical protein [Hymenobacter crusticola]OUJ73116.1 hypothetical protein BXP70_14880 [Hymenobacter crusticola]
MAGSGISRVIRPGVKLLELHRPLFAGAAAVYGLFKVLQLSHWVSFPTYITSYLADLTCMPILLTLTLVVQRRLTQNLAFIFPSRWLVAAWLYVSVVFEGLVPQWSSRYVSDPLDVVAYALGTLAFRIWLNRPALPH